MPLEQTLSIIKPDAVSQNLIGAILHCIEKADLRIVAAKRMQLTKKQAQAFYAIHQSRPFFDELTTFISSAPIMVQVLEGKNAVKKYRTLMGTTDPKQAEMGTIRQRFATSIDQNAVHGSDSLENAAIEIAFFFSQLDIIPTT